MAEDKVQVIDKESPLAMVTIDKDILQNMQSFQKKYLQPEPKESEIRKNKFANNSKYLPISFMEMTLDEIFFGLWQTKNFNSKVVANEIIGELELWYFHPVAKTWLCRIGAGAVQIQMVSKEKGGSGDITNIRDKIVNTLSKDYPHLKAECFRNACLSIGKSFGRDLNREFDDQYNPVIPNEVKQPTGKEIKKKILDALDSYKGEDKEKLRKECQEKLSKEPFDELFANIVINKLGIK